VVSSLGVKVTINNMFFLILHPYVGKNAFLLPRGAFVGIFLKNGNF